MASLNCKVVGQNITRMHGAFDGIDVFIDNTYKTISPETYKSIQTFSLKKDADKFCVKNGFSKSNIRMVETRFQIGYAIGLGRNYFAPRNAQSIIIAHNMGCIVMSIKEWKLKK